MTSVNYSSMVFAENRSGEIWLHNNLQEEKWKHLHDYIVRHEMEHDVVKGVAENVLMDWDLRDLEVKDELRSYFLEHPASFFWYLSPFSFDFKNKHVFTDYYHLAYLVGLIGCISLVVWVIVR